jgi:hypothetical protein
MQPECRLYLLRSNIMYCIGLRGRVVFHLPKVIEALACFTSQITFVDHIFETFGHSEGWFIGIFGSPSFNDEGPMGCPAPSFMDKSMSLKLAPTLESNVASKVD